MPNQILDLQVRPRWLHSLALRCPRVLSVLRACGWGWPAAEVEAIKRGEGRRP